ncbi:holin [Anaerovorax odorimutans]|uniref:holin n=1 Tax=Anaerovorax odorimutans TaxID=109327 RepID=UPI002ED5DAE6
MMKDWIRKAGIRAIKTVAQAAVAMIGTAAVISDVDWRMVVSAALLAGVLSLLTSVAGLPELTADESTEETTLSEQEADALINADIDNAAADKAAAEEDEETGMEG